MAEARSEVSKAEELLEEMARHAAFLDAITPAHHFQVSVLHLHHLYLKASENGPFMRRGVLQTGHIKIAQQHYKRAMALYFINELPACNHAKRDFLHFMSGYTLAIFAMSTYVLPIDKMASAIRECSNALDEAIPHFQCSILCVDPHARLFQYLPTAMYLFSAI